MVRIDHRYNHCCTVLSCIRQMPMNLTVVLMLIICSANTLPESDPIWSNLERMQPRLRRQGIARGLVSIGKQEITRYTVTGGKCQVVQQWEQRAPEQIQWWESQIKWWVMDTLKMENRKIAKNNVFDLNEYLGFFISDSDHHCSDNAKRAKSAADITDCQHNMNLKESYSEMWSLAMLWTT